MKLPTPLSVRNIMLHDGEYYDIEGLEPTDRDDTATILHIARVFRKEHASEIVRAVNNHDALVSALAVILADVDYTSGACQLNEMISAVLPKELIEKAKAALKNTL